MQHDAVARTDPGPVRESNEDCFLVDVEAGLFIVADGMGGHASGEIANPDGNIESIARPIFYFPEIMRGDRLLAEFPKRDGRMAIVVDEYGGASGILTPGDIVGTVMGDLADSMEADVVTLPSGAYEVEGIAEIEEIEDLLKVVLELDDITTVAGFLMQRLGRMPVYGDKVREAGFIFQVTEISGPKVKKVKIQPAEPGTQNSGPAAVAAETH